MDAIELPARSRAELEQVVSLIEQRKQLLDGMQHRSVLAMITNIPPILDSALDQGLEQVRRQLGRGDRSHAELVTLRVELTPELVELVEWAVTRYEHARATLFPGSMPPEWERAIDVYAQILQSAADQLGIR